MLVHIDMLRISVKLWRLKVKKNVSSSLVIYLFKFNHFLFESFKIISQWLCIAIFCVILYNMFTKYVA